MTDAHTQEDAPDTIEQGRRLVRAGGAGGLSLADRLVERFHRLTWRTPIHAQRLNGRYPLKLLAVPDDPLPGDVGRGEALLDGRIEYRGEVRDLAALDFARPDWSRPFGAYVHGFGWLRDLSTVATRVRGAPVAEAITARWLAAHADRVAGEAWRPGAWGRRILAWCAHAPLILSSPDQVYRSRVLNTLARGARHLDRGVDKAPAGAERVVAWAGVVTAGMLLPGGEPRRAFGEAGLARALGTALFDDGGAASRSPRQLLAMVETLAMLRAVYDAVGMELPDAAARTLARMVPALLGVTHGDGGLSSWQGGGPVPAALLGEVIAASGVRTRPLRQARDWGYQRLAAGGTVAVLDAAPPPMTGLADGGCASTLAFELSDGDVRLVVNCGGARDGVAGLPAGLVEGLRTTAAHSTLTLADTNSTAILADGTLGCGVGAVELGRQESEGASRIEASHDGYARRFGLAHRRTLLLTADGRELRGEDQLLPEGRRRRSAATTPFAIRFHLGSEVEALAAGDGASAILGTPDGGAWHFLCRGGTLEVEDSVWIDGQGVPLATRQIVVAGEAAAGGATIGWAFRRAG